MKYALHYVTRIARHFDISDAAFMPEEMVDVES